MSVIQTHVQNLQLGRQTETGKMMVLGRHETRYKPIPIIRRTI